MTEKKLQIEVNPWLVLATVILGTLLIGLDRTVVSLGLPKIITEFGITVSMASWVSTAYIISNAIFVPVFGKLGDMIGNKKIYLWSFIAFVVFSVLAGMSWSINSLIFFRTLQGLVGAAVYPTAMSLIAKTFREPKSRTQALGIWSASMAASSVFGPLIGGPLIDAFSWRMLFYVNLPVGLIGIVMVLLFLPDDALSAKKKENFDYLGSLLLGISLTSLVLVLDKGRDWGWSSQSSLICYFLMVVFSFLFVFSEKRAKDPIIDLKFFHNKAFVTALAISFVSFGGMMGSFFLVPVFAQMFLGLNATQTGYLFLPMALTMLVSAPIGAKLINKFHTRYIVSGGMMVSSLAIFILSHLDPRTTALEIALPLMLFAVGMGLGMGPLTNIATSSVPPNEVGIASAILNLTRNIAGAVSIALFSTTLSNSIESNVMSVSKYSVLNVPLSQAQTFPALVILKAEVEAYGQVFLYASAVILLGALISLSLEDLRLKHRRIAEEKRESAPVFAE